MILTEQVKALFRKRVPNPKAPGRGRVAFVEDVRHALGLCDDKGRDYRDAQGQQMFRADRQLVTPERFSLKSLAEAIIGPTWERMFNPVGGGYELERAKRERMLVLAQGGTRATLEATGAGVDPTSFLNINTFTAVVGGLVEVKVLEKFQNPGFIGDRLMKINPTKLNGQKVIGVTHMGDVAEKRALGQPHKRTQFAERFVSTPETRENALAVDVLKETVFFDLTGQVMDEAGAVGEALGYRKELEQIDCFLGLSTTFSYMGVNGLALYADGTLPAGFAAAGVDLLSWYKNDISSNELLDWTALNKSRAVMSRLTDPHTGKRILQNVNTLVVNPEKEMMTQLILGANGVETRQGGANTQATAPQLNVFRTNGNAVAQQYQVLSSPLIEQRLTDSATSTNGIPAGAGLAESVAVKYWWMLDPSRAFWYMQNWPLTVTQAPPQQYEMMDRGIVATYFANERGIPAVIHPWAVQQNKG